MSEGIIIALITTIGTIFGALIGGLISARATIVAASMKTGKPKSTEVSSSKWLRRLGGATIGVVIVWGAVGVGIWFFGRPFNEAVTLLDDKFDNSEYDGSLNLAIWTVKAESNSSQMSNVQNNGMLKCILNPIDTRDNEILSSQQWKIDKIKSVEWRIKIENAVQGKWAALSVGFKTGNDHRLTCDFMVHEKNPKMRCFFWGLSPEDYLAENIQILLDTWHTIRIEVVPDPPKFSLYLDERFISSSTVKDAKPWQNNYVQIYSNLGATNSQDPLIGYIDYVTLLKR